MTKGTHYYIRVNDGNGAWVLRWPNGSLRRFRSLSAAQRCLRHLPVGIAQRAEILPVSRD